MISSITYEDTFSAYMKCVTVDFSIGSVKKDIVQDSGAEIVRNTSTGLLQNRNNSTAEESAKLKTIAEEPLGNDRKAEPDSMGQLERSEFLGEFLPCYEKLVGGCRSGNYNSVYEALHLNSNQSEGGSSELSVAAQSRQEGGEDEDAETDLDTEGVAMIALSDNSVLDPVFVNYPVSLDTLERPLHMASMNGYHRIVLLLLQYGASPCALDARSRYPYFLAKDKLTRDAFRRYLLTLNS
jgi:hypothetical protein